MRITTVLLLAGALLFGATAAADSADEAALREFKTVLWPRAYREQDAALLDRLLHPDFQFLDETGARSTKAQEIDWIRGHKTDYARFRFEIERLDIYGDAAVVDGVGVIENDDCRKDAEVRYRSSNFFVKQAGAWRAVASHVSGSEVRRPATCGKTS